jgi:hypothetical protein
MISITMIIIHNSIYFDAADNYLFIVNEEKSITENRGNEEMQFYK